QASDYFHDPEELPLEFSLLSTEDGGELPSWLTLAYDGATGVLTFNAVDVPAAELGEDYLVTLVVTDASGATLQAKFELGVRENTVPRPIYGADNPVPPLHA